MSSLNYIIVRSRAHVGSLCALHGSGFVNCSSVLNVEQTVFENKKKHDTLRRSLLRQLFMGAVCVGNRIKASILMHP